MIVVGRKGGRKEWREGGREGESDRKRMRVWKKGIQGEAAGSWLESDK